MTNKQLYIVADDKGNIRQAYSSGYAAGGIPKLYTLGWARRLANEANYRKKCGSTTWQVLPVVLPELVLVKNELMIRTVK
jgi:hypothetical protein